MRTGRLARRSLISASAKLAAGFGAGAALAACGATPTPQVIEKVVEKEVTKIIEGTPQVVKETVVVVETQVVEKQVTVQAAGAEKVVLRFIYDETPGETTMNKINKVDYEAAHPEITVNPEPIGQDWIQKTLAAVVAGTAPDVLMGFADSFVTFRTKGVYEDITDFVTTWPDYDDFWPAAVAEVATFEGRIYGVPYCFDPVTMYFYHKSKFDEAGLPYPNDTWTYEDMEQYAISLTKVDASGNPTQWGYNGAQTISNWGWQRALPAIYAYGGQKYSDDLTRCMLAEPEALEALTIYYELKVKYHASPTPQQAGDLSYYQMFASGRCCFQDTGPWAIATYQEMIQDAALKNQWDTSGPPTGPKGRFEWASGNNYGIWSGGKHKTEAMALLQFLTDQDREKLVGSTGRRVPARRSAAESFVVSGMPDNQIAFPNSLEYAITPPIHPTLEAQIADLVSAAWESVVLTEKRTPEEAITEACGEVDTLLQQA
ncbi:MAG: ABC transporter substrate-binding protein [Anaerolineae bacterium]